MKISGQNGELGEDWWSLMLKIQQLGGSNSKESACQCRRHGFDPWVGRIRWRRAWHPTPVFLPRESPWTEEPDGLQSMGSQKVGHVWATTLYFSLLYFLHPVHLQILSIFHQKFISDSSTCVSTSIFSIHNQNPLTNWSLSLSQPTSNPFSRSQPQWLYQLWLGVLPVAPSCPWNSV